MTTSAVAVKALGFLCAVGLLFAQRADRATIAGIVTDPSGNVVGGTTVRIHDNGTGVDTTLTTNDAGAYQSPLLVLGNYTVTVEHPGFKSGVRSGIQISGGQEYRIDISLELGTVSEKVEVSAEAQMVNTEQPDVANTVDQKYYENLPIVMGGDIRLAESLLQMQPGYTPMRPNGDPMFRGSQFGSRINGGQSFATENFFDGVAFGYASGHQNSQESAPPVESVAQMQVIEGSYSAQYGHTSGGTIEYTSKSGTSDLHGSAYEYFANDALNARGFFNDKPSKVRNNAFGFTVGGPVVIPKIYHGRNRTFFFTNFDWLKYRSGVLPGFGNTTPTDAFKQGNFGALLTSNQLGTDALGRPIYSGQIFNPSTTRLVGGVPVRDPYPGNIIPASDPLRSQVAAKIIPLMAEPGRAGITNNVAGNPSGDQTWVGDFRTILFRVDHQITDKFKTASSFYWPHRPAIRNCGEVLGCTSTFDPQKNSNYFGNGFYQRIATQHANQQFDYIIKNNLIYHSTVSWDRWFMGGSPLSSGLDWPDRLWGTDKSGIIDKTAGPPNITFSGNTPYTQLGMQWIGFGFEAINRWQFVNDLTWIHNKHTIKVGYEYRYHQFNFHGWAASTAGTFNFSNLGTGGYDAKGNSLTSTGDPFASFLLGQVQQTNNYQIPAYTAWRGNYNAIYINDVYKATRKLTLTLGLRFDYQGPWSERYNRFSTFDPSVANPAAGGRPGAMVFASSNRNTFDNIPLNAWGPRFGFAYQVNDRTVLRGGYGIYYAGVAYADGTTPIQGFQSNLLAPNTTNGLQPAFYLDNGFPRNLITFPPNTSPSVANGTSPVGYVPTGLTLPRYQNWSFTIQRQLSNSLLLDISYTANHGTRLPMNGNFVGLLRNDNSPSVIGLGSALLQSDINSPAARAAGIPIPYAGFTGNVAQALRPFPQYQNIDWRAWPIGKSIYHSLQVKVDKRFTNGGTFRLFYTRSKLINNGAENGQNGNGGTNFGLQNPINSQIERAVSADDVPNTFVFSYSYELPFGKNSNRALVRYLLSGWTLNGLLRYESGRPLNITMNNDLSGILFTTVKHPNVVAGANAEPIGRGDFDPNRDRFLSKSAWTDPGPLQFGNAPPQDPHIRGFRNYVEDVSLFKETTFAERFKWRLELQGGNVFNRVVFCDPNTNWSSTAFGQVSVQCNQPRSVQLGTKIEF
jgi:hypothetical protein